MTSPEKHIQESVSVSMVQRQELTDEAIEPSLSGKQDTQKKRKFSNGEYREKFTTSILLCYVFFSGGWLMGQKGPSFLDVLQLTNTSTAAGSAYFTALFVGIGVGSLLSGPLIDRYNNTVILLCAIFETSLTMFIMPWCIPYWSMVLINVFQGFGAGSIATACTAILPKIWGMQREGRAFMQAMNFSFALAAVLSPLALKPYLIPKSDDVVIGQNISNNFSSSTHSSISDVHTTNKLYVPYSITGAVLFVGIFPFVCMYRRRNRKNVKKEMNADTKSSDNIQSRELQRNNSTLYSLICIGLVGLLLFFYYASEASFTSYLATYAVEGLDWNKQNGTDLTSTFWAALAASRFIGIFASHLFQPSSMIGICSLGNVLFTLGIYFGTIYSNDVSVWIFVAASGVSMSFIFPSIYSWTQEDIANISGKISAYLQIIVCLSGSICPLVLGYFMEKINPIYFLYLRFFLCGSGLLIFVILFFVLKIRKKRSSIK